MPGPSRAPPSIEDGGTLGRECRIRRRWEFNNIHKRGVRVHTKHFVVLALQTLAEDGSTARIGCAISRKVGKAVVRNRIRRLIREVFRRMRSDLPFVDLVVIAKAHAGPVGEGGYETAAEELAPGIRKAADRAMVAP